MPRAVPPPKVTKQGEEYVLTARLLNEFRTLWVEEFKKANMDAMKFTKLSVVALTQLSAILGVDAAMTADQFSKVCAAQFAEAYKQAPKFG